MHPNTPAAIAVTGLICASAVTILATDRPYAAIVILVMTFLFYAHAVGALNRHDKRNSQKAD